MKTDILIIGGGPAGVVAAITAKKHYPLKDVSLIRKEEKSVIPCGIPYIFNRLDSVEKNIMPDQPLIDNRINLVIQEVIEIKPAQKKVILKNKEVFDYDKLILALGSAPESISIIGEEKKGVWLVKKELDYLQKLREAVLMAKDAVIIGGGFIGVEFAEELSRIKDLNVTLVERLNNCLATNFDQEFALAAEEVLKNKGIKIFTGQTVKKIGGEEKAEYLELASGEKIKADLIILSIGARPNISLLRKAGIKIEEMGGAIIDECQRTSLPDIFAAGDCAQARDFITGKKCNIMLASVAATEARIAASNLYQIEVINESKGMIGVFSTSLNGLVFGAAGLIEKRAQEEKVDYIIGEAEALNRHPGNLPGAGKIKVKLIFAKSSGNLLLGGEIIGPESAMEMLNIIAMAIQQKASIFDFNSWQIATHPLLTSAPTVYPLIAAAQNALLKIKK